jgi:hypothetical protein
MPASATLAGKGNFKSYFERGTENIGCKKLGGKTTFGQ